MFLHSGGTNVETLTALFSSHQIMSVKSNDTHVKSCMEEFANIFKQSIQQCAFNM